MRKIIITLRNELAALGNPLDWSNVDKGILLLLSVLPMYLQYIFWARYIHRTNPGGLFNLVQVAHVQQVLLWSLAICLLLLAAGLLLRRVAPQQLAYQVVVILGYSISLSYLGYAVGGLSLSTGIVMVGSTILGFMLFHRPTVLVGFLLALVIIFSTSYASAYGLIPYLPVLARAPMENGHYSLFWINSLLAFSMPHLLLLLSLSAYVIHRWRQREQDIKQLSIMDPLTRIANRRQILGDLEREVERTRRHGPPLAVMMVDLDHFKSINDHYGHQVGDRVLQSAATILCESVRRCDMVGRYGGEEFVVVLPDTSLAGALEVAERCRRRLNETTIVTQGGHHFSVSASFGVAGNAHNLDLDGDRIIHSADSALYRAKHGGRNCVVTDTP